MSDRVLWNLSSKKTIFPQLYGDIETDVLVVGAGITGLTAAYLLANEGRDVVVVEATSITNTATSKSSAHLTTASDFNYDSLKSKYDLETCTAVASSRKFAISFIETLSKKFECGFKYVSGYLYAEDEKDVDYLYKEKEIASKAGLDVYTASVLKLPFKIAGAIEFKNQAIFNPSEYLTGIASFLNDKSNCRIYENSRVINREENKVFTEFGTIKAKTGVYATHYPIFFELHQTLAYPYRSYILAAKVQEDIGDELYWDTYDPYFYTRSYEKNGEKWIIVGGADHKTGKTSLNPYEKLETYLNLRYTVKSIDFQWSNQFYEPADGLPYIGKSSSGNEYIATGYSGNGLTNGTIAGYIISQEVMGLKEKLWNGIFDSKRFNVLASAGKFFKENVDVAKHYVMDRFSSKNRDAIETMGVGEGAIIEENDEKIAVSVDNQGNFNCVKANCTHLNCLVSWNYLEKSWDCPCHGSRFKPDGSVITGPAVKNLEKVNISIHV
jgi:glycine/D-amino acid oxidase-like deaminating enzyme/nitrite reductase/ring-hydroxylating ferredoxin subunit